MSEKSFEQQGGQEHEKSLEIASISTAEYRSGIPIPNNDFGALAKALETYAYGVGEASNATRNDYRRTANTSFNVASHKMDNPRYTEASPAEAKKEGPYSTNPFIDGIVKAAEEAHRDKKRGQWSKSYDYDGQGRFHKTSVDVAFDRENNALVLGLSAAYVGDKVEEELATALGTERAISSMGVKVELPDMADQDLSVPLEQRQTFRLDCAPLATAINSVVQKFGDPKMQFKPEDLAKAFMKKSKYNEDEGSFSVSLGDGISLSLSINGGYRFVYPKGEKGWENLVDTRKIEGSTLVLPFPTRSDIDEPLTDYSNPPKQIKNYSIAASIGRESEDRYSRLPIHTKEQLEKGRAVVEYLKEQLGE